jgi:hypothetical protein
MNRVEATIFAASEPVTREKLARIVGKSCSIDLLIGVVCGRGRNPTLRFRPSVFAGEIDVLPAERRDMGQEIGR